MTETGQRLETDGCSVLILVTTGGLGTSQSSDGEGDEQLLTLYLAFSSS